MEYKKTYINGCWVDGNSDKELKAVNPSNGEVIAVIKENNLDDVKSAVASAKMLLCYKTMARYECSGKSRYFVKNS